MEADLSRIYGIDYRDRWRFDSEGRRKLTLRMIWARVEYLPRDSAVRTVLNGGRPEWGDAEYLLADVWAATAGAQEPHPARPVPPQEVVNPERTKSVKRAKRLADQRRKDIDAGLIT